MSVRPKVLDLFSGAGGLGLGFEQAGFDLSVALELDPIHAAVHSYNFPLTRMICADATKISAREILNQVDDDIDVIIGGAPCQGFSLIGQRALDDPRNQLVKHFLRLVLEIRPSAFVLENVKGLTLGKHKQFLDELVEAFDVAGYSVLLPWRVLNARDYCVPQDRQRLFLIGARSGIELPTYPTPPASDLGVTCADALGDLPDVDQYDELLKSDSVAGISFGAPSAYAATLRCATKNDWGFGYRRAWQDCVLTSSMRTNHTQISRRRFRETKQGEVEPISRFFKLSSNGISNTLRAGTDSARGAFTSPRPIHYKYDRCITVREMARLHGFPDWFRFHVTKWHGARQIGNSVPPPLARSVAQVLMEKTFKCKPTSPDDEIDLGEEHLLRLTMKGASKYWGIEVPIANRDRKSGARKRKQIEVERSRRAS